MRIKLLISVLILIYSCQGFSQFTTTWNTGASTSITIPTTGTGYNYTATIALLDSPATIINTLAGVTANASFTGLTANTVYQVKITGAFPRIYFNNAGDRVKLKAVTQWGTNAWTSFEKAFYGCSGLNITATDVPILTGVTNMSFMFGFCSTLNGPSNIGSWNTGPVTNMGSAFANATAFNQDIGSWNTASVVTMAGMFAGAVAFNQNIGNWNTAAVTDMNYMFFGATAFNGTIANWNTALVTNMNGMFQKAAAFNQDITAWNTASVTDMSSMFYEAVAFNGNIGSWNTASVATMDSMFRGATAFNQNIGGWNTAAVINMSSMFTNTASFNQDIGGWNTASVITMSHMFEQAVAFNQDISGWTISSLWNAQFMFQQAAAFNQDISNWNVSPILYMDAMFKQATSFNQNLAPWAATLNPNVTCNSSFGGLLENCGMSVANYDATLIGFNTSGPNGINLGAAGMYYCNDGAAARANLVLPVSSGGKGWTISGDTSLVTSTPLLATSGNTVTLNGTDCNYGWAKPTNRARKMLMVNENGNDFSPSGVLINHNNIGALPAGVTSANGYYQISDATNSTRISNRLLTIADSASHTENGGVIVRVYYSTSEYTNLAVDAPPVGEIVDAGWFLSNIDDAAGVVADMAADDYALSSAQKIIPFNSGSENGISFVEFKLTNMGTIGLYAKTTLGPLSPDLSIVDNSAKNKAVIYPNPVGNSLNLKLPDVQNFEIRKISITNMLGQTVYRTAENTTVINAAFLKTGIYQLLMETDKGNWNGKFIKE